MDHALGLQEVTTGAEDAFEECLRVVTSFYGVHADLRGLKAEIARLPGPLTLDDMPLFAQKLNLAIQTRSIAINGISEIQTPVILLTKDASAACVYFPEKTHRERLYIPGRGFVAEGVEQFRDVYTGSVLIVQPDRSEAEAETRHMRHGHALDWFWQPIFSNWSYYSEIIICSIFINLFVIALPFFTLNVYDRVIPNFAEATLFVLVSGVSIALLFDFLFKTIRAYILEKVAAKTGTEFDDSLMERLMLINSEHMTLSVGERINLFRELQGIRDFYAVRLAPAMVDLPFFLLFLLVIYLISPPLMLVPLGGAVLIIIVNLLTQIPINRTTEKYFSSMQKKSTLLVETLTGMQTFKLFNAMGNRLFKWNLAADEVAEATRKNQFILTAVSNFTMMIMHMVHVLVVFFGVYQIEQGSLTIGGLIACTILSGRAIAPIMSVSAIVGRLKQSNDILKTIDHLFDLPHEEKSAVKISAKGPFRGCIEIKGVTYQYPGQMRPALQNLSLKISPGEHVGVIGRTGAGKSTLVSLLMGYLHDYEGSVFIDEYGIEAIPSAEIRRTIGIVPQHAFFVSGSIRDNVLLGCEDADEESLLRAIELSGLGIVIRQTGYGLDTEVGENGDKLSGGQRQAISLARAILRDPTILIFDEPTTGMDYILEHHLKTNMPAFLENRTFIMVTHRTSLLSLVDRLTLLESGRVIADGPKDEVLKKLQ